MALAASYTRRAICPIARQSAQGLSFLGSSTSEALIVLVVVLVLGW
jgi:hypothetical protein